MVDEMLYDGLTNVYSQELMGVLAEYTAEKAGLTREMQDELSLRSQLNAAKASTAGLFKEEIVPIELPRKKGIFEVDETSAPTQPLNLWQAYAPRFPKKARSPPVTLHNSPTEPRWCWWQVRPA